MASQALVQSGTSSTQLQRANSQNAVASKQAAPSAGTISTPQQQNKTVTQNTSNATSPQQVMQRPSPAPMTPGKWEHPRMAEIIRRQQRTTFDQTHVQRVLFSTATLVVSYFVPRFVGQQYVRSGAVRLILTASVYLEQWCNPSHHHLCC